MRTGKEKVTDVNIDIVAFFKKILKPFLLATSMNALQVMQKHLQAPHGVCFSRKFFHLLQEQQRSDYMCITTYNIII